MALERRAEETTLKHVTHIMAIAQRVRGRQTPRLCPHALLASERALDRMSLDPFLKSTRRSLLCLYPPPACARYHNLLLLPSFNPAHAHLLRSRLSLWDCIPRTCFVLLTLPMSHGQ